MKLSIIVPIYNVSAYLSKCVESLLNQDYSDYEIILVDDGSTDDSGSVADKLASEKDSLIRVIHQKNQGLSGARNTGIEAAKGEYIVFVDSDDYWEPNVLGELMKQVERDNLEVLRFKYQHVNEKYEIFVPYKSNPYQFDDYSTDPTDGLCFLNNRMGTACFAVMFIVMKRLITNCKFTPGIYFEDTDWTPRMLLKAKRVASTDRVVYNYLMREGSITHAVSRSKQQKVLDDMMRLLAELQRQSLEIQQLRKSCDWFKGMIANTVISIIGMLSTDFYQEKSDYLKRIVELNIYPLNGKYCNKLTMRKLRMINVSPNLAVKILHYKNK